jgi:hypothetical protein
VESPDFAEFQAAVRRADLPAAVALLRRFEPALRSVIRRHLADDRLRRVFETSDILQSVLKDFLRRQRSADRPPVNDDHIWGYLLQMVRRKIATKARRKAPELLPDGFDQPAGGPAPPDRVADRLLLRDTRDRLPPAEQTLFDRIADGHTWTEIAAGTNQTPNGLRMRLRRAIAKARRTIAEAGRER